MSAYLTDEEQVERLQSWIKEYAPIVLSAIAFVLIISFAWRYWQTHQERIREQASSRYEQLILDEMNKNDEQVKLQAKYLIKEYPKTSYAGFASLLLARADIESNHYPDAIKHLDWAITTTNVAAIKAIAQIRLSRVLFAQNKLPDALHILNKVKNKAFASAVLSVKGDIYMAMNDKQAARNAYQQALTWIPQRDSSRAWLEMKLADIAQINADSKKSSKA